MVRLPAAPCWRFGALVLTLPLIIAGPARAAWDAGGTLVGTLITTLQQAASAPNGQGGAYVVWAEGEQPSRLVATQIGIDGAHVEGWPSSGRVLAAAGARSYSQALGAPDGEGGLFAAGTEVFLSAPAPFPFVVTRGRADGAPAPGWPDTGLVLADGPNHKVGAVMVADGLGGAYLVWLDAIDWELAIENGPRYMGVHEPRVLRLDGDGLAPGWPAGGVRVATAPPGAPMSDHLALRAVADGAGGVIVAWADSTDGVGAVRVLRLDANGAVAAGWPAGGRTVCNVTALQYLGGLAADGAGGAFASWYEYRDSRYQALVTHIDGAGATAAGWPASGRSLTDDPSIATAGPVVADGLGGVLVGLQRATGVAQYDLFASHVTAAGTLDPIWATGGLPLATSPDYESFLDGVPDEAGSAYFLWVRQGSESGGAPLDAVLAAHVTGTGTLASGWPAGGLLISGLSGLLSPPASLVADGHGGALAIWVRRPFSSVAEVRAYRLGADGLPTTEVPRTFAAGAIAVSPNPSAGITRLAFTLAGSGPVRLGVYDVSGRRVRTLESGALPAGSHTRQWDGRDDAGAVMPAGLYLVRASGAGLESSARIVRVK